jgi:glutathione reductase (NADPH)
MEHEFDLVVIGTGAAGSTVASTCRSAGWNVAIVDYRPYGGTCALRGCNPKKVLVGASEAIDRAQRFIGRGLAGDGLRMQWRELVSFKRTFTDPVPARTEQGFDDAGIRRFHGPARFVNESGISVDANLLYARNFVIATGAAPIILGVQGEEHLTTSEQFLDLEELPERVTFIGGGYISFEFAHVAARAGARPTIVHRGKSPLHQFDPDLVAQLVRRSEELGIDVKLESPAEAIEKTGGGYRVSFSHGDGQGKVDTDLVVHGAGRVPEIAGLGLGRGRIEHHAGIRVNEFLQSISNPRVYAAGDAVDSGGFPLTPVAGYQGRVVAANLLQGNHQKVRYHAVPSVVFTLPPLASVGESEASARTKGISFATHHEDTSNWFSSRHIGETCSGFKVLIEEGTERIVGAHLLGPRADELINVFALSIRLGLTAKALKEAVSESFAFPTCGSDIAYML